MEYEIYIEITHIDMLISCSTHIDEDLGLQLCGVPVKRTILNNFIELDIHLAAVHLNESIEYVITRLFAHAQQFEVWCQHSKPKQLVHFDALLHGLSEPLDLVWLACDEDAFTDNLVQHAENGLIVQEVGLVHDDNTQMEGCFTSHQIP